MRRKAKRQTESEASQPLPGSRRSLREVSKGMEKAGRRPAAQHAGGQNANPSGAWVRGSPGSHVTSRSAGSGTTVPSPASPSVSPWEGACPLPARWGRCAERRSGAHADRAAVPRGPALSVHGTAGQTLHLGHLESQAAVNGSSRRGVSDRQ